MTLHWWMHWFWVTLWFTVVAGNPLSVKNGGITATTGPTTEGDEEMRSGTDYVTTSNLFRTVSKGDEEETTVKESFHVENNDSFSTSSLPDPSPISFSSSRQNFRVPKAIGIDPTPSPVSAVIGNSENDRGESPNNLTMTKSDYRVDRDAKIEKTSVLKLDDGSNDTSDDLNLNRNNNNNNNNSNNNRNLTSGSNRSLSLIKKDSKVTWILTANKTSRDEKSINQNEENRRNSSFNNDHNNENDNLAVLPLDEPIPTRFKLVLNRTKFIPSTNLNNHKILNKSDDVEIREDIVESRLLATAASILQGVSESPRLSRARSAFPGDYQQDEQLEQKHYKPSENGFANATSSAVDIAAVTGSCLATLVLIGTMGSLGFVMYRRRYMNPPQTLNSDKCSNPDSSGYIDDSTIRDNSEEMYSLDNDSFLNSLEAMTIQNYWTDSVKHTKL